jgi:hypothetical protein
MHEADIIGVLKRATTAAVLASTVPALPVAYLDLPFNKPNDGKWLEIVWIPNNRTGDFWGDEKNYQGIYRLILHWPKKGDGVYVPLAALGSIADYFSKERVLSGVQIYETPDFTGSVPADGELLYPVSMRYQSYRS